MKTKLLLLILWSLSTSIYAQSSLTFEPEDAMPTTFDSWSTSFLIVKTDVKAGDKFIFFTEPVEVPDWEWGPQIQPKNNSDWSSLTTPLSPDAEGKIVFVLNEVTANFINDNGGLRVQGMGIRVLDVQFEAGSEALLDVEGTIVWAGDAIVNGWTNQPYLLSDGGMELKTTNAEVGDILRFYMSAPDIYWQIELFEGHWAKQYVRWSEVPLYNEDGSERESVIIDLTNDGYAELEITQEILDNAYKSNGWGGVFLLNGMATSQSPPSH